MGMFESGFIPPGITSVFYILRENLDNWTIARIAAGNVPVIKCMRSFVELQGTPSVRITSAHSTFGKEMKTVLEFKSTEENLMIRNYLWGFSLIDGDCFILNPDSSLRGTIESEAIHDAPGASPSVIKYTLSFPVKPVRILV